MSWSSINPKSAREKAYIVLERAGKPLHYRKIAKQIKETNFYSDHNPTAATVHNEVILDDRFVLIGRGIYGLKKWGYRPGTVEDVIVSILKKHPKGLDRSKIVDKVLDQRKVAKNTTLANLNRKSEFIKKEDQIYALK
jgi:DNA-directed RNA polymerase delta subunit